MYVSVCILLLSISSLSEHSSDQHSSSVNHAPHSETTPTPTTREQLYQALYDYDSQQDGDLQFKAGDIVQVSSEFPCGYKYSYMYMYMYITVESNNWLLHVCSILHGIQVKCIYIDM